MAGTDKASLLNFAAYGTIKISFVALKTVI